ncbi:MAG: hypothetical protein Q9167_004329 [Letrouitia subvulpina]
MSYHGIPPGLDLEDRHPAVGAWFLGPRAENFHILKDIFESTLKSQEQARINLYPKDQPFITPEMQAKPLFQENIRKLASRNLKFYPLSLKLAISKGSLGFLTNAPEPFNIQLCDGTEKPFLSCSTWGLLNLKPKTVLNLPQDLYDVYGISQTFLQNAIQPYLIQTIGKDSLEDAFGIKNKAVYYVGTTKHYSWPKGAAIAGIGSDNVKDVPVDNAARMNLKDLDKLLAGCIDSQDESKRTPVYAVVAIMGSTEQGAVDPLANIIKLRGEYQKKGLSFVVHCDGAWGGYFASMVPEVCSGSNNAKDSVPIQALQPYTREQLIKYSEADSITIDPHKSGYVPYPAGALCYRDGRMRYLITWTSPVVFHAGDDVGSIGVYGVEGSKPGAAPVAAFLSHEVIGLNPKGYGTLLGEATFTCTMLYSHWATITNDTSELVVVPFNMLPAEKKPNPDPKAIEEDKEFIRKRIINKSNLELVNDKKAMEMMAQLGSDLMINAFACNFRVNGKLNEDVGEANYLNQQIFQRTSISLVTDSIKDRPIILTSTSLAQSAYQGCLTNFKNRLGLKGEQNLTTLINVTMSPWPTTNGFLKVLVDEFRKVAEEELKPIVKRNTVFPDDHGFVMQGTDKLYLVHMPMFYMANHRHQVIISGNLPDDVSETYKAARSKNPGHYFVLGNADPVTLSELTKEGASFKANIYPDLPKEDGSVRPICDSFILSNINVVVQKSLATNALSSNYPVQMPFYLYGIPEQQHIDHLLLVAPNVQLNSDQVTLDLERPLTKEELAVGVIAIFTRIYEQSIQPMQNLDGKQADHTKYYSQGLNFAPKEAFNVSIFKDLAEVNKKDRTPLIKGKITLGASVWVDDKMLNENPTFKDLKGRVSPAHTHGSGLEAEYPVYGPHIEHRDRHNQAILKGWEEEWLKARTSAKKVADNSIEYFSG